MTSAARALGRDLHNSTMTPGQAEQGVQPSGAGECITVALIPTAAGGLRRLLERTNLSMTDIANRAITSYEFFDAYLQAGRELIVRDTRTGETQLVRFL
jgi:hypothetical protein